MSKVSALPRFQRPIRFRTHQRAALCRQPVVRHGVTAARVLGVKQVNVWRVVFERFPVIGQRQIIKNRALQIQRAGQNAGINLDTSARIQRAFTRGDSSNHLSI